MKKEPIIFNDSKLDKYQKRAVLYNRGDYLIIAGAGSGKTLTISAKIENLVKNNVREDEILCISFTNETVNNLKRMLNNNGLNVSVMTYHKLALFLIKDQFSLVSGDYLEYITTEYFYSLINTDSTYKLLDILTINKNKDNYIKLLINVVVSFIHNMKVYDIGINKIIELLKINMSFEDKCFLIFIIKVYSIYDNELKSYLKIDFDDMINISIKEAKNINNFRFKYIIIDEYQDISYSKYLLVKTLKERFNMTLIGVGDDYQSIYSFSGCDVKFILRFKDYFSKAKIIKLKYNYRNPKDIVEISKRFVLENPNQIRKKLSSRNYIKNSINLVYTDNEAKSLEILLKKIDNVLIIGRNNKDIDSILKNSKFKKDNSKIIYENKNIRFLSVHKAKGLEEEHVVILNVVDDVLGFPNKLPENNIIKYIVNNNPQEEERRLFYVALTRAKKKVYIFTKRNKESIYIKELLKKYRFKIKILELNL